MKRSTLHPTKNMLTGTIRGGSWLSAKPFYEKLIKYIMKSGRVPREIYL